MWLSLLDRDGAYYGRLAEEGTFQRFNPGMNNEYELEIRSSLFHPGEDARWAGPSNGFRIAGASISHPHILNHVDWRQEIHISGPVDLMARYRRERSFTARRDYPWVGVRWRDMLGTPWTAQVGIGVHFFKPSADVEVALARSWRDGEDRSWTLEVRLAALDAFNETIFQGLGVRADEVDAHYDYAGVSPRRPHDPEGRGVTLASGAARGIEPKERGAGDFSGHRSGSVHPVRTGRVPGRTPPSHTARARDVWRCTAPGPGRTPSGGRPRARSASLCASRR